MCNKVGFIWGIARHNYRSWFDSPRVLIITGMVCCLLMMYAMPFSENAMLQEQTLHMGETFVALLNWRFSLLLFSTATILLFGDMPMVDRFTATMLMYGNKKQWYWGQLLYIVLTSFGLSAVLFLLSVIVSGFPPSLSSDWSRPVKLMALSGRVAIPSGELRLTMNRWIVTAFTPWQALAYSSGLFTLMTCCYGVLAVFLRMAWKNGGITILLLFNVFSWSVATFNPYGKAYGFISFLSLHYHASLYRHEMASVNKMLATVEQSVIILLCVIFIVVIASLVKMKKFSFVGLEEKQG